MTEPTQKCVICDTLAPSRSGEDYVSLFQCPRCGDYKTPSSPGETAPWQKWAFDRVRHLVSAWVRGQEDSWVRRQKDSWVPRQNDSRPIPYIMAMEDVTVEWCQSFEQMGFPETLSAKQGALLLSMAREVDCSYQKSLELLPKHIARVAAKDGVELEQIMNLLNELGCTEEVVTNGWRITARGWKRIEKLQQGNIVSDAAFVAMWFHDATREYRASVAAALGHCGYRPIIMDQEQYTGFIMDQMITLIRQSRFLVADFTAMPEIDDRGTTKVKNGARGGVYWEAGFAFGLGRPVIHTCRDDEHSKRRVHFDVDQYNTIFWNPADLDDLGTTVRGPREIRESPNFAERLAMRILATVGRGPKPPSAK